MLLIFKSQEFEINQGLLGCNIRTAEKVDNDKIGVSSSLYAATMLDSACRSIFKHRMKKYVKWIDSTTNMHLIKKENWPC